MLSKCEEKNGKKKKKTHVISDVMKKIKKNENVLLLLSTLEFFEKWKRPLSEGFN